MRATSRNPLKLPVKKYALPSIKNIRPTYFATSTIINCYSSIINHQSVVGWTSATLEIRTSYQSCSTSGKMARPDVGQVSNLRNTIGLRISGRLETCPTLPKHRSSCQQRFDPLSNHQRIWALVLIVQHRVSGNAQ